MKLVATDLDGTLRSRCWTACGHRGIADEQDGVAVALEDLFNR